jgi:hypothetical protein
MKICYIVLTCEKYIPTRVQWQNATFFKTVDVKDIYFLSCRNSGENIYGWNTGDYYEACPIKYMCFFRNMLIDYDWYVFIDDDTFINTKNIKTFLELYDASIPYYMGIINYTQYPFKTCSGGAGFVVSKNLYHEIVKFVRSKPDNELYYNYNGDVTVGYWVSIINEKNKQVNYLENKQFHTDKHVKEEELENFISFHYLKSIEDYEYYYSLM